MRKDAINTHCVINTPTLGDVCEKSGKLGEVGVFGYIFSFIEMETLL